MEVHTHLKTSEKIISKSVVGLVTGYCWNEIIFKHH